VVGHSGAGGRLADRAWQPNDGLQAVADALFQNVTARSQYLGLPPMRGLLRRLVKAEPEVQPAKPTTPKPNPEYQARLRQAVKEGRAELGIT